MSYLFKKGLRRTVFTISLVIIIGFNHDVALSNRPDFIYSELLASGNLNPYGSPAARATNDRLYSLIYQPLFRYDFFDQEYQNILAEKLFISDDRKTLIVDLKKGVYWHDGEYFTAEDVRFTMKYIRQADEGTRNRDRYRQKIESIRMVGHYRLRVTLSEPYNGRYPEAFFPDWIIPAHLFNSNFQAVSTDRDISRNPVGTGPFSFVRRTVEGSVYLEMYDKFWDRKALMNNIQMELTTDINTMVIRLAARVTQLIIDLPPDRIASVEATNRHRIIPYQSYRIHTIGFNFRKNIPSDQQVRQAIIYGTNRDRMLSEWYANKGELLAGPYTSESPFFDPELEPYAFDPDKAKRLLTDAGYRMNPSTGYFINNRGQRLELDLVVPVQLGGGETPLQNVISHFEEDMRRIGIHINVKNLSRDAYEVELFRRHNFDLIFVEWEFDPLYNIIPFFHSRQVRQQGMNVVGYTNTNIDDLFNAFELTRDPARRMGLMRNAQQILKSEAPYMFMFTVNNNAAIDGRFTGIRIDPFYFFTYINYWQYLDD